MFDLMTELPQERTATEPLLMTTKQAARALTISERTLYSLTKSGAIPAVRLGPRGLRYDPADLRRWIESAKERG